MKKILFLIVLYSSLIFSQNKGGINQWKQFYTIANKNIQSSTFDQAYSTGKEAYKISKKIKNDSLITISALQLYTICQKTNTKEARQYIDEAEKIALTNKFWELLNQVYLQKGNIHYEKVEDNEALKNYLKIDSICVKNKIKSPSYVSALSNIANVILYSSTDQDTSNWKKSEAYIKRAHLISKQIKDSYGENNCLEQIGILFLKRKKFGKALQYYKDAVKIAEKSNNISKISSGYWGVAGLYFELKKLDSSEFYFKKRIQVLENRNANSELAIAYSGLGSFYNRTHKYNLAIQYNEKAISYFNKYSSSRKSQYLGTLNGLSNSYAGNKEFKKAFEILSKVYDLNDSLTTVKNREASLDLEAKYQTEKKEQEIQLLSEQSQKQKIIYLSLLAILLAGGAFIFYGYRNKIKTAQKLNELNELKSRFFANISHEFRTPLTLIKSPVQSLQNEIHDVDQKKKLNLIDKNSDRMLELVNQLLELSKIDSGNLKLIFKEGSISAFLNSIIEPFEYQAKENNIAFKYSIEKNNNNHYFDKDVIEKIVTNLVSNAFKYSIEKEKISFTSSIENTQLQLVVSNTGTQLKKQELPELFQRFYQKNENQKGFGIGLALVKELVELYQGNIETKIENNTLFFTVTLPLEIQNSNALIVSNQDQIISSESKTDSESELPLLLIVDDNPEIRAVLNDIFKTTYIVLVAEDGEKALKLARKEIPDCIISDVMMPKMNGFEFTKNIKSNELTSFIPVILLTAKTSEDAHLEGIQSTADAFLTKPFNNEIIKATVNQLIAERKKLQERYSQELVLRPVDIVINSVDEKFLEKIQDILNAELSNSEFSTDDFATAVGMSRMQLHRKLKTLLGVSATEFLRSERLKTAVELLKKGNGNISEIAYSVGFNDVSYFSKCFKETYNCTPTEFVDSSNPKDN